MIGVNLQPGPGAAVTTAARAFKRGDERGIAGAGRDPTRLCN